MRRLFTTEEAFACGLTIDTLRWGIHAGRWRRLVRGVYGDGPQEPSDVELGCARVMACPGAAARGHLAGVLHQLDSVTLDDCRVRKARLPAERICKIGGVRVADGLQTLIDLAPTLDDLVWEQALESALRKGLATVSALDDALPGLAAARVAGTARIRRVLALRPPAAPPTESLLETLMIQLARDVPEVGEFVRQHVVRDEHDTFIARPISVGRISDSSSSSTVNNTRISPCTTPCARPR